MASCTAPQVVDFFDRYARSFGAPVLGETRVERVSPVDGGYHVVTDQATWFATNVVIATGATRHAERAALGGGLAPEIDQITPNRYRAPSSVRDGGVLVVGASATGVQLADELARAGRSVVLAVGAHTRGVRQRTAGSTCSAGSKQRARTPRHSPQSPIRSPRPRAPSLQLVGGTPPRDSRSSSAARARRRADGPRRRCRRDARAIRRRPRRDHCSSRRAPAAVAVRVRSPRGDRGLVASPGRRPRFADRARARFPRTAGPSWISVRPASPPSSGRPATAVTTRGSTSRCSIRRGELVQTGGVTAAPGLYVVGLRFQSRRNSNFIDGVGHDARTVVEHLTCRRRDSVRVAV